MICFLCLDETGEMLPIFGFDGNVHNSISHIIEKYLDIKPPLPVENKFYEICSQCWQKLTDFHEYYQNIKSHEEQRLKMVELNETKNFIEIKEEIPYISSSSSVADEYETEDPFLSVLDKEYLKDNTTPKAMSIKPKKRMNPSTRGKSRKKEDNFSIPANEIKSEELENVTNSKNNETKRRKGYVLLEENEELIRKHIQMLCQICPHTCCEFQDLVKHFKEEHPDVKPHVKCCERKLDCPSDILQHAYYHENPDYFKCNECGKTFINKSGLRDHYVHNHEPEENLSFACDECPRRFSRKNLLEHHKSKHVPEIERSYYCETCVPRKAFANEYTLQLHIKNRHMKAANICHVCAKEIRDKQAFEKHVRQHFEKVGPRIKCPREDCDRWLKDKDSVKQHLRRFHDVRGQYECPQCGRICKNKHSLRCHLKNTHPTKNFSCEECQKNFKSQQTLKEHMAGHTGDPLYNCPFCSRTFNSKANMYSHKKKSHPEEWEKWNRSRIGSK